MLKIFKSVKEWRAFRQRDQFFGKTIGFVPTMGNLHLGHRALIERSVRENDFTVLSIFVNPTQFNNREDLEKYPRTQEADIRMVEGVRADYILMPEYDCLYPDDYTYRVQESVISKFMEGRSRPGHFDGMLTVVLKLLQLVRATRAYFGEKDYQQLQLVRGLVDAFFIDTEIVACSTVRDENGLALSSRNSRLSEGDYDKAVQFAKILQSEKSSKAVCERLDEMGIEVDYIEDGSGRRFGAVNVGGVRLIDNYDLKVNEKVERE